MRNTFLGALLFSGLTLLASAEEGTSPAPAREDKTPVKATHTEVRKEGTTTTTQEAQRQTNRAPNNEAIPERSGDLPKYDSEGATAKENAERDARGVKGSSPTSKSAPDSTPEYDSDGATKNENDRRDKK